jgi:rubrerythrin
MIAQRTKITGNTIQNNDAAVSEAMRLLATRPSIQRWVCEVCGMVHTGAAPGACDSCGASSALVQRPDSCREMNSHW